MVKEPVALEKCKLSLMYMYILHVYSGCEYSTDKETK